MSLMLTCSLWTVSSLSLHFSSFFHHSNPGLRLSPFYNFLAIVGVHKCTSALFYYRIIWVHSPPSTLHFNTLGIKTPDYFPKSLCWPYYHTYNCMEMISQNSHSLPFCPPPTVVLPSKWGPPCGSILLDISNGEHSSRVSSPPWLWHRRGSNTSVSPTYSVGDSGIGA